VRALRTISNKHRGENVLIVMHGGVINQILGGMWHQRAAKWQNCRPGNAALTELLWNGNGGEVVRVDHRENLS
jgi:broad specificity phosphatase PhoE